MSDFTELFGVNSDQVLKFFFDRLKEEVISRNVSGVETLYVASILAHYAQTPCRRDTPDTATPRSLYDVLDSFVLPGLTREGFLRMRDSNTLEVAGSQTLLLAGFFRDQAERRLNPNWYDHVGRAFFERASEHARERKRAELLAQVARHFPVWTISCRNMSRTIREERYLLKQS